MIESLVILPEFENYRDIGGQGFGKGYRLPSLPVGTKLDINSLMVVIIGDNGSGKSTLLEKICIQLTPFPGIRNPLYFDITYADDSRYRPLKFRPEEQVRDETFFARPDLDNEYGHLSSGEYQKLELMKFLEVCRKAPSGAVAFIDEPELHFSLMRKRALADTFATIANERGLQFIIATHEPSFLAIPHARIIVLDNVPAGQYNAGEFNLEEYQSRVHSL